MEPEPVYETAELVRRCVDRIATMGEGSLTTTHQLAEDVLGGPVPGSVDMFSLHYGVLDEAARRGIALDGRHHRRAQEGLPYNLNFYVRFPYRQGPRAGFRGLLGKLAEALREALGGSRP